MTRYLTLLSCGLLIACGGKDGSETDDTDGDDTNPTCTNEITDSFPKDGTSDVYYRTTIEFTLASVSGNESIKVTAGGEDVAGSTKTEDNRVVFTPATPLDPSTTYDVELDWDCGPTSLSWTTSSIGSPTDEGGLVGNAYALDIASGRFVKPPGVGPLIQQQLDRDILIGVTSASATEIEMMGALATSAGVQDVCTPSIDFPVAADFSENPFFEVSANTLTIEVQGISITIDDLVVSGAFAADGSSIEGAILAGAIDTRALKDLLGTTEDDGVCELVSTFGVNCETCSDGSGDYCLSVYVDSMQANLAAGISLESISEDDIAANPACD